jgi:methanogenic corrinoid protein MtbC1
MKLVSQRTGLSPHVLRIWERRYAAVTPERSDTNRRLYAEEEVERLSSLALLTESGHAIRQIANLPTAELQTMAAALPSPAANPEPSKPSQKASQKPSSNSFLDEAWSCIAELDSSALRSVLNTAAVSLGLSRLTTDLVIPLIQRIGDAWAIGEISIAEEHAASAVIKEVLLVSSRPYAQTSGAPKLVVATPAGQLHELGATLVACTATRHGWDVTYLGPSLPSTEIARAAVRSGALAVGLSIVYPNDDPQLADELRRLRDALPDEVGILIGGRSASAYQAVIEEIGATISTDLSSLSEELETFRTQRLQ